MLGLGYFSRTRRARAGTTGAEAGGRCPAPSDRLRRGYQEYLGWSSDPARRLNPRILVRCLRRDWKPWPSPFAPRLRYRWSIIAWLVALAAALAAASTPTGDPVVEEMKTRVASASPGERPHLCVQIAERQLAATDKLYTDAEVEQAQAAMTDVVTFSELARDYAIQSHKYQKQTEIAVRTMARKLADIKHLVAHEDQAAIQGAIARLQRVRDDLLIAMFPKGAK
jgi:hypothetical protein